jgi:hypothetical protein
VRKKTPEIIANKKLSPTVGCTKIKYKNFEKGYDLSVALPFVLDKNKLK